VGDEERHTATHFLMHAEVKPLWYARPDWATDIIGAAWLSLHGGGKVLGERLMREVMARWPKGRGHGLLLLSAQVQAARLYQRLGFIVLPAPYWKRHYACGHEWQDESMDTPPLPAIEFSSPRHLHYQTTSLPPPGGKVSITLTKLGQQQDPC